MSTSSVDELFIKLAAVYRSIGDWLQRRVLSGRYWLLKGTALAALLSLFMAFPNFGHVTIDAAYLEKAQHPWVAFGEPGSHEANLTYRLTGALLCQAFAPTVPSGLVFMAVCTVLLLACVMVATARLTGDRMTGFFVGSSVAWLYPGSAGFATGIFAYDPLGFLLVVAPFVSRNVLWIFGTCFLAAWTDERAFLATSFALLHYALVANEGKVINFRSMAVVLAGALYLAGRFLMAHLLDLSAQQPTQVLAELQANMRFMHFCTYYALEGLWLIVAAAVAVAWMSGYRIAALGLLALLGGQLLVGFTLNDLSRAAAYALPAIFPAMGLLVARSHAPASWLRPVTCVAAILSAIGLNYFVISWPGTDRCIFHPTRPLPLRLVEWAAGSTGSGNVPASGGQ